MINSIITHRPIHTTEKGDEIMLVTDCNLIPFKHGIIIPKEYTLSRDDRKYVVVVCYDSGDALYRSILTPLSKDGTSVEPSCISKIIPSGVTLEVL